MAKIFITSSEEKYRKLESSLRAALSAALFVLHDKDVAFDVSLLTDSEMRRLNRLFRKKSKATNVLSFEVKEPVLRPDLRVKFIGEIFLAPDYIKEKGESLLGLAVHGLLHLMHYTHDRRNDRIKMEALEKRIVAHIKKSVSGVF